MKIALLISFTLSPVFLLGKNKPKNSHLSLNYSNHLYFDKRPIVYDEFSPNGNISPRNTLGHSINLHYEKVFKSGILVGGGLCLGNRKYDVTIHQDISNLDNKTTKSLNGKYIHDRTRENVFYWASEVNTGYQYKINNKTNLIGRFGLGFKMFYDGVSELEKIEVRYLLDNGVTNVSSSDFTIDKKIVRDPQNKNSGFIGSKRFPNSLLYYDMYVGIRKPINNSFFTSFTIGIEGTHGVILRPNDPILTYNAIVNNYQYDASKDTFHDSNISLGIRLGIDIF
jgi:hypothetical protein